MSPPQSSAPLKKYRLVIAYDGAAYNGWQIQKIGQGVQAVVEAGLAKLFPSEPRTEGSSRTDQGVHAVGMCVHFTVPAAEARMTGRKLLLALNAHLPEDIRVVSAAFARPDFHARFDAVGKEYRYFIWNHPAMNPLWRRTAWHVPRPLDLAAMRRAAEYFIGEHDFRSFTANPGYDRANTVRHLTRCEVRRVGSEIRIIIEGGGFLYKMCRAIAGTLVQVGLGRFPPEEVRVMLAKLDRRVAGMTAPAHGLVLWRVKYPRTKAPAAKTSAPSD